MSRSMDGRVNPVFKAMNRPLTVLGAERRLFFVALISGGSIFSLFHSLFGGIGLFIVGTIAFIDEGLLSIGKFVRFFSEADPLLRAVGNFEMVYVGLSDFSFHAARAAFRNRFFHAPHRSAGLFDGVQVPAIWHRQPLQPQFTTLLLQYSYPAILRSEAKGSGRVRIGEEEWVPSA